MRSLAVTLAVAGSILFLSCLPAQTPADTTSRISAVPGSGLSVTKARALALIPGAGHFYADESGRGLGVIGGMTGLVVAMSFLALGDCLADAFDGSSNRCEKASTAEDVATVAFLGVWAWSIYDAGHAARRTNARRTSARRSAASFRVGLGHTYATANGRQRRGVRLGLSLPFR